MKSSFANRIPEGCRLTKGIRDARLRIAHVTRDALGNYSQRPGWVVTDIVCEDKSRICIQYDGSEVPIDVPAAEVAITACMEPSYQEDEIHISEAVHE